jgi:hypothetical protein
MISSLPPEKNYLSTILVSVALPFHGFNGEPWIIIGKFGIPLAGV